MRKFTTTQTQEDIKNVDTIEKLEAVLTAICNDYLTAYPPQQLKKENPSSFWKEIQDYLSAAAHTNQSNASKILNRLHDYKITKHWPTEEKIILLKESPNLSTLVSDFSQAAIIRKNLATIKNFSGEGSLFKEISIAIFSFYKNINTPTQSEPVLKILIKQQKEVEEEEERRRYVPSSRI